MSSLTCRLPLRVLGGRVLFTAPLAAVLALGGASLQAQAHHQHGAADALGTVSFGVSCSAESQRRFDRALALLHHMMYVEARAGFEEIVQREPTCAMAHWGVGMTSFQPLWYRPQAADVQRGWDALQRARAHASRMSERERALLAGTEAFFRDPAADEWFPRLRRWANAMRAAHEAHPDDSDIAAFYALSVIAAGQGAGAERLDYNARAARVLLQVHARVPDHPGALHYTIHANDVAGREQQSLDIVRSYDGVAPNVPHALHMPTHIFVRLGQWPEVIEWNRRSADAALKFPAGDRTSFHHVHALDYLLYAHLQRGNDAQARKVLDEALRTERYEDQFAAAFHLAIMPARHAIERRAWSEAAQLAPRTPAYLAWDRFPWPEALSWFARGMGAVHTGDTATAARAESRMRELASAAERAGAPDHATYIEVDRHILSAAIARSRNQVDTAVALLRQAAELEATVQKHPVTPGALLPPYEALGDLLLDLRRPTEALSAYESALAAWPARYRSMLGAARAAVAANDREHAMKHYRQLLDVVAAEGATRDGIAEARTFVARR